MIIEGSQYAGKLDEISGYVLVRVELVELGVGGRGWEGDSYLISIVGVYGNL